MNDHKTQKENFPLNNKLKHIKGKWNIRIDLLQQFIVPCELFEQRRNQVFFKIVGFIKGLQGPSHMQCDKISTKEEFGTKLKVAKITLDVEFDSFTSFNQVEMYKWLIDFVIDNVEHNSFYWEHCVDLNNIENDFFSLRVKE